MSLSDKLMVLFGKNVTRDAEGMNARLHFFGSIPVDDGTPFPHLAPSANEHVLPVVVAGARPKVVALVSVNGGVGRSTLATALSSGLQRFGESVVTLELDPQNALGHHFGINQRLPGMGQTSLKNAQWADILHSGFAGSQVITFGPTDLQQQQNLRRWLEREPHWLAQHIAALGLGEQHTVIIDTPAGNNVYFDQALRVADVVLVVAQADAASLSTLDQLDTLLAPHVAGAPAPSVQVVINQLNEGCAFSLDMVEAFKQRLGKAPLEVHHDVAISEALAFATDPLDSTAMSLASDDINELCRWLMTLEKKA